MLRETSCLICNHRTLQVDSVCVTCRRDPEVRIGVKNDGSPFAWREPTLFSFDNENLV